MTTKTPNQTKWKLVVVVHSHWDREWYLSFQEFRLRLVRLVDEVVSILERDPSFEYFMLDGQTVVLEDYLDVRPDRRPTIEKLVRAGRLFVGPWYVLPDEFLVSGESLIRNLQIGHRIASGFGRVMKVGYIPDTFGHIAQMPQILCGFGIDNAVLWRGVPDAIGTTEFCWRAPDGTGVFTLFLATSYSNARGLPSDPEQLRARLRYLRDQLEPLATTDYVVLMNGNDHAFPQPSLPSILETARGLFDDAEIEQGNLPDLIAALERGPHTTGLGSKHPIHVAPTRPAGADGIPLSHNGCPPGLPTVVGELRSPRRAHLLPGVFSTRMWIKQANHRCETLLEKWAEPFSAWAGLFETLGHAVDVVVDAALDRPATLSAETQRKSWPGLIDQAWRYLLQNQAHDSICGCSIDTVHEEMRTRYAWSEQIATTVTREALNHVAHAIDTASPGSVASGLEIIENLAPAPEPERPVYIVVFNAASGPRTDFVTITAQAPSGGDFLLVADDGARVPYQVLRSGHRDLVSTEASRDELEQVFNLVSGGDPFNWPREKIEALESVLSLMGDNLGERQVISRVEILPTADPGTVQVDIDTAEAGEHNYPAAEAALKELAVLLARGDVQRFRIRVRHRDEVEIGFVAQDVPGFGYRTYHFLPGGRQYFVAPLPDGEHYLDNEFYTVQASPRDGTLTVIDKESGVVEQGLNLFVDGGDAGDEYNYSPPPEDLIVSGPAEPPTITRLEYGPTRRSLRVEQVLRLPARLGDDRQSRSRELVDCPIVTTVTLYPGVRRIDVEVEVDNRAADHRLRVHFPTKVLTDVAQTDATFAIFERPIAVEPGEPDWAEQPVPTFAQKTFTAVTDGSVGLLIANQGLPECEVIETDRGTTIALTLLRCVGWLSRDDLRIRRGHAGPPLPTPGAQNIGCHTFRYAIVPFAGSWQQVFPQAHAFNTPLRAVATDRHSGILPAKAGLIEVSPSTVIISAIKPPRDGQGLIARVYNAIGQPVRARLSFGIPFREAERVTLNEEPISSLPIENGQTLELDLRPAEIATIRLRV